MSSLSPEVWRSVCNQTEGQEGRRVFYEVSSVPCWL